MCLSFNVCCLLCNVCCWKFVVWCWLFAVFVCLFVCLYVCCAMFFLQRLSQWLIKTSAATKPRPEDTAKQTTQQTQEAIDTTNNKHRPSNWAKLRPKQTEEPISTTYNKRETTKKTNNKHITLVEAKLQPNWNTRSNKRQPHHPRMKTRNITQHQINPTTPNTQHRFCCLMLLFFLVCFSCELFVLGCLLFVVFVCSLCFFLLC